MKGGRLKMFRPAIAAIALITGLQASAAASAATQTKRLPSDIDGVDLIVSCEPPPQGDYVAETDSGVSLTDPYAVARGADKGLVHLMTEGGKPARRYAVTHALIRRMIRIRYDMDVLDRADVLFTPKDVRVIHTTTANAGVFTSSDVYVLPYGQGGRLDMVPLKPDGTALRMLEAGRSVCG
jgi:hypothetical protein